MVIILKTGKEKNMISFLLKCPIPKSTSNSIVIVSISLRSTTSNHSPFSGKIDMFITHCLIMVKAVGLLNTYM